MAKILHTADFHLDSAFTALPEEKARLRRQEARQLTDRLVDYANDHGVELLLLAGISLTPTSSTVRRRKSWPGRWPASGATPSSPPATTTSTPPPAPMPGCCGRKTSTSSGRSGSSDSPSPNTAAWYTEPPSPPPPLPPGSPALLARRMRGWPASCCSTERWASGTAATGP